MLTRDELYERQARLQRHYDDARRELMRIPGVTGVGIGLKRVADRLTEDACYRVYVEQKQPEDGLPPEHVIPKSVRGIATDVLEKFDGVAPLRNECPDGPDEEEKSTLRGGIQITNNRRVTRRDPFGKITRERFPGTLGCFATLTGVGATCLLTNHHVLYAGNASVGDKLKIGQPEPKESICCDSDVIATTFSAQEIQDVRQAIGDASWQPGFKSPVLDCAVARLETDRAIRFEVEDLGPITGQAARTNADAAIPFVRVAVGQRVRKRGRTSCVTVGVVEEVDYNEVFPLTGAVTRDHQILITPVDPTTNQPVQPVDGIFSPSFTRSGDSGSLVLNEQGEVVGLLWAVRTPQLPDPNDPTLVQPTPNGQGLVNHIELVTDALHIDISFAPPGPGGPITATVETPARRSDPEPLVTSSQLFRRIAAELSESENGRHLLELVRRFDAEVIDLINHDRPVMVAWRRNRGPAFVAAFISHGLGKIDRMPVELDGVRLGALARIMADRLCERGSPELAEAIASHRALALGYVDSFETLDDVLRAIGRAPVRGRMQMHEG